MVESKYLEELSERILRAVESFKDATVIKAKFLDYPRKGAFKPNTHVIQIDCERDGEKKVFYTNLSEMHQYVMIDKNIDDPKLLKPIFIDGVVQPGGEHGGREACDAQWFKGFEIVEPA